MEDCERQQTRLKGEISVEYDETKTGYSDLYGLLVQADRIAEDALQALEYTAKNSLAHARYLQLGGLRT